MDPERLQISEDVAKTCRHCSAIPKVNRLTQTSTAQGQVIDSRDRHGRSMLTAHSSTQSFSAMRRQLADFAGKPAILKRTDTESIPDGVLIDAKIFAALTCSVTGWSGDQTYTRTHVSAADGKDDFVSRQVGETGARQSVHKVARQKGVSTGRTYTSRYRGVHQTFPTRRWEAQFRRNGKPTSLGCFDHEEEAARAYDRMMVWCELHCQDVRLAQKPAGHKPNISTVPLNFAWIEYEGDFAALKKITQDELVHNLRRQGRMQAATNGVNLCKPPVDSVRFWRRKQYVNLK